MDVCMVMEGWTEEGNTDSQLVRAEESSLWCHLGSGAFMSSVGLLRSEGNFFNPLKTFGSFYCDVAQRTPLSTDLPQRNISINLVRECIFFVPSCQNQLHGS